IRSQPEGFKEGGYTGNIPKNAVAGQVHGQEYVFDANATRRIGVANLEALRTGSAVAQNAAMGRGGIVNVTVENYAGPGIEFETQQLTENDVVIIARRVVSQEADGVVAGAISNPNS